MIKTFKKVQTGELDFACFEINKDATLIETTSVFPESEEDKKEHEKVRTAQENFSEFRERVYSKFMECVEEHAKNPCFFVIDVKFVTGDGNRSKLVLIKWCADKGVPVKQKMLIASSFKSLESALQGVHAKLQLSSMGEFEYDELLKEIPQK